MRTAVVLVALITGGVTGLWWTGALDSWLRPAPAAAPLPPAAAPEPVTAPAPKPSRLSAAPAPAPIVAPDPQAAQRARERLERIASAERGVAVISRDLADRRQQIAKAETWLERIRYEKTVQRARAYHASLPQGSTEKDNARVSLANLLATIQERQEEMARDREIERSLEKRLASAQAKLEAAR